MVSREHRHHRSLTGPFKTADTRGFEVSRLRTHQALAAQNLQPPEANLKGIRKVVFQKEAQLSYISGLLKLKKFISFYLILELEFETS